MAVRNVDIAAIFSEIADLLDIENANPIRIRAYRNAAWLVGDLGEDIQAIIASERGLSGLPGIGSDLAGKICEIVDTGKSSLLDSLRREVPPAVSELLRIPNLGPKRVRLLWQELDIQTVEQLYRAAGDGRIREVPGFGEKFEQKIRQAVEAHLSKERRLKLAVAAQYAEALVAHLIGVAGVERVEVAGSFRRQRETVGGLDILVVAAPGRPNAS